MSIKAGEILQRIRGAKTQRVFAEELGISQASLNFMENNKRGISDDLLKKIREKYDVDIKKEAVRNLYMEEWLKEFKQSMGEEKEPITFSEKLHNNISALCQEKNVVSIPFYNVKASAGTGEILPDYEENEIMYFDKRWLENIIGLRQKNAVLIQAKGDSMDSGLGRADDIKDGDLLLLDDSVTEFINNQIYVVSLFNTELYVKRIVKEWTGEVTLVSNNPNYPPIPISEESEARIIGRVMWNGSKGSF